MTSPETEPSVGACAAMPLDDASTFIRPSSSGANSFGDMAAETARCPNP
jgi:hypothetical protein